MQAGWDSDYRNILSEKIISGSHNTYIIYTIIMKMKYIHIAIFSCFAILLGGHLQAEGEPQIKIAKVDYEVIQHAYISDLFHLLDASNEVKQEVSKLILRRKELITEVLKENDPEVIKKLKAEHARIEDKLETINTMITDSSNYSHIETTLQRYIVNTYGKEYQIIVDMNFIGGDSFGFSVSEEIKIEDITKRIIDDLGKIIP